MPWWALTYVVTLIALSVGGVAVELRERRPIWYVGGDVLAGLALTFFVWSYFHPDGVRALGMPFVAVFFVVLAWNAWQVPREVEEVLDRWRAGDETSEDPPPEGWVLYMVGLLVVAPALIFGGLSACRVAGWSAWPL